MPLDGPSRIDVEIWQVQVRPARASKHQLVTLELVHDRDTDGWGIRSEDASA